MKNLKRLRERLKITQSEAARLVGVDANSWARWERGERQPRGPALRMIEMLPALVHQKKPTSK